MVNARTFGDDESMEDIVSWEWVEVIELGQAGRVIRATYKDGHQETVVMPIHRYTELDGIPHSDR